MAVIEECFMKPKRNKKKICFSCGEKIVNKQVSALYCKVCTEIKKDIAPHIYSFISQSKIRNKYKDYNFSVSIRLVKIRN